VGVVLLVVSSLLHHCTSSLFSAEVGGAGARGVVEKEVHEEADLGSRREGCDSRKEGGFGVHLLI